MTTSRTPGTGHDAHGKPVPPPVAMNAAPDETGDGDSIGLSGAGMVGHKDAGLDEARRMSTGTTHGSADDARSDDRDMPIGSALASDQIRGANDPTTGAGADLTSGPDTLGAATGGERAVAGRSDANRSSRDHGSSRN
ncbi:hypothetical protein ACFFGH_17720 [Lysobacter korlensis]|uniref:Uncharacterized protein n=1 Tax=Lysobacter korlensis TaxID=553636 RepID=A0ABV6RRS9_9GAMM